MHRSDRFAAGQSTGRKAPARSTSALATKTLPRPAAAFLAQLDQLAAELGRCCYQLTGHGGDYRPRSLVTSTIDLAGVVEGMRLQMQPEQAAEGRAFRRQLAGIASRHFARSA